MSPNLIKNTPTGYEVQGSNFVSIQHNEKRTRNFRDVIIRIENAHINTRNGTNIEASGIRFSELSVDYRENIAGDGPLGQRYAIIVVHGKISHIDGTQLREPKDFSFYGQKQRDSSEFQINAVVNGKERLVPEGRITAREITAALSLARTRIRDKADQLKDGFAATIDEEKRLIEAGEIKFPANGQEIRLAEQHLQKGFLKAIIGNQLGR